MPSELHLSLRSYFSSHYHYTVVLCVPFSMFSRGCSCIWDFRNNKCNKGNQPEIGEKLNSTQHHLWPERSHHICNRKNRGYIGSILGKEIWSTKGGFVNWCSRPGNTWTKHGLNNYLSRLKSISPWGLIGGGQVVSVGHCHNSSFFCAILAALWFFWHLQQLYLRGHK